jgi:hypothetical protein
VKLTVVLTTDSKRGNSGPFRFYTKVMAFRINLLADQSSGQSAPRRNHAKLPEQHRAHRHFIDNCVEPAHKKQFKVWRLAASFRSHFAVTLITDLRLRFCQFLLAALTWSSSFTPMIYRSRR